MDCCSCNCVQRDVQGRSRHSHLQGQGKEKAESNEAASPLAPGDRYPQPHHQRRQVQQVPPSSRFENRTPHSHQNNTVDSINPSFDEDNIANNTRSPKTTVVMTGNGFFVASSGGGLAKAKSGTLPPAERYSSPRGFRDTFVSSMTPPPNNQSSNSATSSPHHAQSGNRNASPAKESPNANANNSGSTKKWTFGGLFKRKVKTPNNASITSGSNINTPSPTGVYGSSSPMSRRGGSMSMSSPSPAPSSTMNSGNASISTKPHPYAQAQAHQLETIALKQSPTVLLRRNPGVANGNKYVSTPTQTRHKGKVSESDTTSEDSELEGETETWSQPQQQPVPFKQNFLTRRLSRRKEKVAAKKKAAEENGLLKVPKLNNGKRVGSSPDSLNNGNTNIFGFGSNGPWPSWEITKKVPQLQAVTNYSSSGSLSLSQEGSTKGSRAAAKEAVKARAVARRESFIQDSSSDTDGERSRSSIVGSHSSLTVKNRGRKVINGINGNANNNYIPTPPQGQGGQTFRPVVDYVRGSPSSPAKFDRHNNNSPSLQAQLQSQRKVLPPGSPRWEARVYTQQNHEEETQFVVKLPSSTRQQRPPSQPQFQQQSGYNNEPRTTEEQVIMAGLRVPISGGQNGNQITEEVHYANLPNGVNHNVRSATPLNYQVNFSPPAPPPRRDYSRQFPSNQNFYRPVSCSYLDSYQGYYNHNQTPGRNASPIRNNINRMNATSFNNPDSFNKSGYYENHQHEQPPVQVQHQHQFEPRNGNNYYYEDQVDNARHNNNFLSATPYQNKRHMALIRSPSEPPEIKVQYARDSPVRRNASTPTPSPAPATPAYHYNNNQDPNEPAITSKLGFPVRKLYNNAGKIPLPQSPVHFSASEFWRKKESEVTGNPVLPNTNHLRYMNRIRSADSSPLPIRRMRNSPVIQNSNESISSLSSFSAEAGSPHSNMFAGTQVIGRKGQRMGRKILNSGGDSTQGNNPGVNNTSNAYGGNGYNATVMAKNPSPFGNPRQESGSSVGGLSKSDREKTPNHSANDRLKVRAPSAPTEIREQSNKIRSLVELDNGKSPGKNMEEALNELDQLYKSLCLSDEDLLDRAERRDLPTLHQQLRNAPLIPLPESYKQQGLRYETLGSVESLATGSSSTGSGGTNYSSDNPNRVRAPPLRRSARPDTVQDDMAKRRFEQQDTKPLDPRTVVSKTGSYMVLSPAFSPPVSPCPPETLPFSLTLGYNNHEEPDLCFDDVSFRQYQKANSIKIIDPQPKFGIPLGPITAAPGSDYLHSKRSDRLRPLFKATKNPDLVNDDIAFRNLRKDLNSDNNLSKDWTPRLFSPTRDNTFTYNLNSNEQNKKLRAIRSLSANITNYAPFSENSFGEIGKWNSFTDLHQNKNNSQPRASSYWRPSWVEEIEKVQTRSERNTTRGSNNKFHQEEEPEHWERKLPSKTVQLTPDLYDPTKPRRPWTDIILESFEKEQQEIERARETAAANANVNSNGINDSTKDTTHHHPSNNLEITEEDDDVFLDARDKSKSTSPEDTNTADAQILHKDKMLTNYANFQVSSSSFVPLLAGQNTRRGSWVEPRTTLTHLHTTADYMPSAEDRRRKSWSEFPKDSAEEGQQEMVNNSFRANNNPLLPPLRKIKQIPLEKFSSSPEIEKPMEETNSRSQSQTPKHQQNVLPRRGITKGEEDLNALMDILLREADTCGPVSSKAKSNSSSINKDKKTTRVNVSLSAGAEREFESNQPTKLYTKPGMTQKDSLDGNRMLVPKIPQKESQIDEPTKRSMRREEIFLASDSKCADSPEIVAVSRKRQEEPKTKSTKRIDNDNKNADKRDSNLPLNYSTTITTTTSTNSTFSNENETFPSSLPQGTPQQLSSHSKQSIIKGSSTIEELIDSINESLPELEAGCSPSSKKSTGGSSLSSVGSGSGSPPSVPSPRTCSPTTIRVLLPSSQDLITPENLPISPIELGDNNVDCYKEEEGDETTIKSSSLNEKVREEKAPEEIEKRSESLPGSRRSSTNSNTNTGGSSEAQVAGPSSSSSKFKNVKEEEEAEVRTNEQKVGKVEPMAHFHFLQSSSPGSRSKSHGGESVSSSPSSTASQYGEVKEEKDKSHRRKSHLNRALITTDDPVPNNSSSFHTHAMINTSPKGARKIKTVFRPEVQAEGEKESSGGGVSISNRSSGRGLDYQQKERNKKSSTSICKVPAIPSILTTNNHSTSKFNRSSTTNGERSRSSSSSSSNNGLSKSPDNSISTRNTKQLPQSPSSKPKSSILNKVQTFESQSVVKPNSSVSDAEGVSFIKKLLNKESMAEKAATELKHKLEVQQPHYGLKKSPSAESTHGSKYWSKFSNSQPVFFKKFFDKGNNDKKSDGNNFDEEEANKFEEADEKNSNLNLIDVDEDGDKEPVISYSVAQKASFFMKLEHEQRFSKWRKNSLDGSSPLPITNQPPPAEEVKVRLQLTQPITTSEVPHASSLLQESSGESLTNIDHSTSDNDQMTSNLPEPSKLSLKDRVHMFDKLIAVGVKAPSSPYPVQDGVATEAKRFPMSHSSSGIISSSSIPISQRVSSMSKNVRGNLHQGAIEKAQGNVAQNQHTSAFQRRGSTSDLEVHLSIPSKYSPVASKRSFKARSLYVNNDELSEDGEVSSGGQEVNEIISRSYENSPVARKKSWRNQKPAQATFTKEIWRRCKVNENNMASFSGDHPQTYKVTTNVTHKIINEQNCENPSNMSSSSHVKDSSNINPNPNSSPATSNLLQILTVLTSSNDELVDENKTNANNLSGFNSDSLPSKSHTNDEASGKSVTERSLGNSCDNGSSIFLRDTSNLNSSRVPTHPHQVHQVHVPHPDDESFQLFFGTSSFTQNQNKQDLNSISILTNDPRGRTRDGINLASETPYMDSEMNFIQRESDLLVMKKNVPLLRRKSSGKSRNPMRTLAARIDFHNQWYTDGVKLDEKGETKDNF